MKIKDILKLEIDNLTAEIKAEETKLSLIPKNSLGNQREIIEKKIVYLTNELKMAEEFISSFYANYDAEDCVRREQWLLKTIAKVTAEDLSKEEYLRQVELTIFLLRFIRELFSRHDFLKNSYLINSFFQ